MNVPAITLTATLQSIGGNSVAGSALKITLCGLNGQTPKIAGTSILAQITQTIPYTAGALSAPLWGNDVISPAGTYYMVQTMDADGNATSAENYILNGNGSLDLSSLVPYAPPKYPVPPPVATTFVFTDTVLLMPFTLYIANGQIQVVTGGTGSPVAGLVLLDTGNNNNPVTIQITDGDIDVVLGGTNGVPSIPFTDALTGALWNLTVILVNGVETPNVVAA